MSNYKPKTKQSIHSKNRFSHRYHGEKDIETITAQACHYGIRPEQVDESMDLAVYLEGRAIKKNKAIRLFEDYVFVFSKSKRLITMYPLPDEYKGEYQTIKWLEASNKKRYRELKRK